MATAAAPAPRAGSRAGKRKEINLDEMVTEGAEKAYEALQLYRSRAMRFQSKNDIINAVITSSHGAIVLLRNNYITAGAELANMTVEIINEAGMEINPQVRQIIFDVDSSFPAEKSVTAARIEFLKACVKSTIANGQREYGEPQMHARLASCLWDVMPGSKTAIYHFALGEDPEELNRKIDISFGAAHITERDQALTLGVLHFLAYENLRDANELFKAFKKSSKLRNTPSDSDLVTFCDYLLQTSRRDAAELFKKLASSYARALSFDEICDTLLWGPIASKIFNIPPKANPMMSMLQNLLS